ncbi:MAG: membrane dipeptidase [Clostridia bacterium]|nr:membrane dipeptidase [Clostridia bacterium]
MIICDTHCDTLFNLAVRPGSPLDVTMDSLQKGGVSLQTLAMFVGKGRQGDVEALFDSMFHQFDLLKEAGWRQVDDPREAVDGQVSVMLSIEGCEPFDKGLHVIEEYRRRGVRMAAVTWNHENTLAHPASSGSAEGLKPYGVQAVREMQRLGIAVDVSHLNDAGVRDLLALGEKPPMASHSNCRALVDHPRNLSDDLLRGIFQAGGYVAVNFWPTIVGEPATIDRVIDHIVHMYEIGGEGKVGFGSDFDGIERKPEGLNSPADFPRLIDGLRRRGFAEKDVEDIAGLGLLRYFGRIAV